MRKNKPVFLDGASNTPLDKKALSTMKPYLQETFVGNSASPHDCGIKALSAIINARKQVAEATGCLTSEVYFTSGATEGNNWAIYSVAREQLLSGMKRPNIVCCATEHSSVLNACKSWIDFGFEVSLAYPDKNGRVTLESVQDLINDQTCLVCVMATNNETGMTNDVNRICSLALKHGAYTLVDCTQEMSLGFSFVKICTKYPFSNFYTFSAHKLYGPTGVGCLITDKRRTLSPIFYGGSQENGLRGGTSNTAGIVGLGRAVELLSNSDFSSKYTELFLYFYDKIKGYGKLNFISDRPNIISANFAELNLHTSNLAALLATYGICVSAGSACDANKSDIDGFNPSHVLAASGLSENDIRNTIRISFTKHTTKKDIDRLFSAIENIVMEQKG